MARSSEYTHPIRIRETQLEMPASSKTEDYDGSLKAAEAQLAALQKQREDLERKKQELQELTTRKERLLNNQSELGEKLSNALTLIDREIFGMRKELEDLDQTRKCFAGHLEKLEKIQPENWSRENLRANLDKAIDFVDLAADDYDQAAKHFENTRSGAIFGRGRKRTSSAASGSSEFATTFKNGLAFNLPVVSLGIVALVIYFLK